MMDILKVLTDEQLFWLITAATVGAGGVVLIIGLGLLDLIRLKARRRGRGK